MTASAVRDEPPTPVPDNTSERRTRGTADAPVPPQPLPLPLPPGTARPTPTPLTPQQQAARHVLVIGAVHALSTFAIIIGALTWQPPSSSPDQEEEGDTKPPGFWIFLSVQLFFGWAMVLILAKLSRTMAETLDMCILGAVSFVVLAFAAGAGFDFLCVWTVPVFWACFVVEASLRMGNRARDVLQRMLIGVAVAGRRDATSASSSSSSSRRPPGVRDDGRGQFTRLPDREDGSYDGDRGRRGDVERGGDYAVSAASSDDDGFTLAGDMDASQRLPTEPGSSV